MDILENIWIQVVGGLKFYPMNPKFDNIPIESIAYSLARICRFTGHIKKEIEFYSVAQHCVLGSYMISPENALSFLMHEIDEFALSDLASPIKKYILKDYNELSKKFWIPLAKKYNLPYVMSDEIKEVDIKMLLTEKRDLMDASPEIWEQEKEYQPYDFLIKDCWLPNKAANKFLERFHGLTEGKWKKQC